MVVIKKSHFDILFSLDINSNYLLKVVLYIEDLDLEKSFEYNKEIPANINQLTQIQALLKDVHNTYVKRKITENKFVGTENLSAENFKGDKFEISAQNILSLRVEGNNFLLRKKIKISNFHSYTQDERPASQEIIKSLKAIDHKKVVMKHSNFKELKLKELKPTKVDLSKIPSSNLEDENVDEEYKPFLKQTSLSNPISKLNKETFLKHKRRRTTIPKPTKAPSTILNLYNEYQNVFSNLKLTTVNKYCNMQKYKETISN